MIFPVLDLIFLPAVIGLEHIIYLISTIPSTIIFGKTENWFIISYYFIFFIAILLFKLNLAKKALISLSLIFLILIIQYFSPYFVYYESIHFIDVGQGDSILIRGAFNQFNILVDTGGNKNYDLANKRLIPYFKALGIKKLDALILSHDDFDHSGAKDSLIKNFKVDRVIEGNAYSEVVIKNKKILNLNNNFN
jgi:competence protein ComEC